MSPKILGIGAALLCSAATVQAGMINLSLVSSDATPASELSATLDFQVTASVLSLTVTNTSAFEINEVYFNGDDVVDLTLNPAVTGWTLLNTQMVNGWGSFDYALIDGVGAGSGIASNGGAQIFTFDITGGSADMNTFTTNFSTGAGMDPMIAAAKFIVGPTNDDSAFGAFPAPGVTSLAFICASSLATRRRRA